MRCTISWSLLTAVYWSRDKDGIGWKVFAEVCPWMSIRLLRHSFRLHLARDTAAEKDFDIEI